MSSTPLSTIYEGDVTLEQGSDTSQYGYGDLKVARKIIANGTEDSTGTQSQGALLINGGARIEKNLYVQRNTYVLNGVTNLTETHIDTTNGPTSITGGNALDISVGASSQFVSTGGNLALMSTSRSLQLYGGLNGSLAIDIQATDPIGGIQMLSNRTSIINGSGGLQCFSSMGNISISANGASASVNVNSTLAGQNLSIGLYGNTDSQLILESSGISNAIVMNTLNTAGNISISNALGLGNGSCSFLVGSGGYVLKTNTGGSISLSSQGASSSFVVKSSGNNQNLTFDLQGSTDSALLIQSSGSNATNTALQIATTHTNGNISINQPSTSTGKVSVYTGRSGFETTTQTGGSINMTSNGATSTYTNATIADAQHLTVSVTGNTNSKVIISSTGTSNEAIKLVTTNGTGGIYVNSVGAVQLQSTDTVNGIKIATSNSSVPVTIGTPTSTTTILGDLYVKGNASTVQQQVVTIDDNIVVLNNAPYGTSDGGIAIKRYQSANDVGTGEVVVDNPDETGTVQNGSNTAYTIKLSETSSTLSDNYKGWWIRILSGTGSGQVRKIKSYDPNTKVATIYDSNDQTSVLGNPQPVEGMDFITVPDITSTYGLYPCHYVMNIWDESSNEFAFVCSSNNLSDKTNPVFEPSINHYSNLHVNDLQSHAVYTTTINDSLADVTTTVVLNDNSSSPVTIPGFNLNYGIYMLYIQPLTNTLRASAIFMIGRINEANTPGTFVRQISVKGTQNEQLCVQWRANVMPELYYRPHPGNVSSTTYKVKIVSL